MVAGFEPRHRVSLIRGLVALWIERGLTALRRCERQLDARISEYEIRGRELLQPKTRLATGRAENVVRRRSGVQTSIVELGYQLKCVSLTLVMIDE